MARVLGILLASPIVVALTAWAGLAIWFDGPRSRPVAGALIAAFVLGTLAAGVLVRPAWRSFGVFAALWLVVFVWWRSLAPSNDRDWQPDVARPATAELHGDLLTIHNVRDFDYRSETDFTERWETRTYDLSKL